ncbi:glycine cleavage T C-terminal barrel domain-containing protein [Jannaschia seohaensis]|uniref:Sarcosine oxidase subunit alpha n=1 Tax=Jannaschia seohaensis TaxID=475081 RepID=A0A2Y9B2U5_9RHOB|nr:glycine cleavage T C-terminal barrel domain-containing protein [Jannaschia seohaensis]PWJ13772.1 sarcosine oxidase subunit alpha [Jannaschia seohaensis]SSA50285.1 sarcosine oxidase subunit alpha [Jannaschia seohaensis]
MSLLGAADYAERFGALAGRALAVAAEHPWAEAAIARLTGAGASVLGIDAEDPAVPGRGPVRGVVAEGGWRDAVAVLVSGGPTPAVQLWRHAGGGLDWCETRQAFVPGRAPEGIAAVGACAGIYTTDQALDDARAAGLGQARPSHAPVPMRAPWPTPGAPGRRWVDLQHDVTTKDVELAFREGYRSVEHLKRYTTLGMALDQGRTANMAGLALMAALRDRPIPEVGTTTFRPPAVPVPLAAWRGPLGEALRHPVRRLVLEPQHRAADARWGEYGGWLRPAWYSADLDAALPQEIAAAREAAALFDGSPLGKIEVMGPDAAAFLDFVCYNTVSTLAPGRIRYVLMLTEAGIVMDDGVVTRIGPDRFVVSCSSGHVAAVEAHLEAWRQDGHDPDRIFIHDATAQWATLSVSGPKARAALDKLALSAEILELPHMGWAETVHAEAPLRAARVSFTGEAGWELSVPSDRAAPLWEALALAVAGQGGRPIGIEALSVLRAEKGYVMIGRDTDGATMPHDLGVARPMTAKRAAFVGDRSLDTKVARADGRKQLVGLIVPEGAPALPVGAHVIDAADKSAGYVTSSYGQTTVGRPVALGLVADGQRRHGETVTVFHDGTRREARLAPPCAFDPEGARLDA